STKRFGISRRDVFVQKAVTVPLAEHAQILLKAAFGWAEFDRTVLQIEAAGNPECANKGTVAGFIKEARLAHTCVWRGCPLLPLKPRQRFSPILNRFRHRQA